jgi:regulator of sigma E protease
MVGTLMITLLAIVVILGLLIFVHEFGHFIAAKVMGVEVKTFAFGFPPRLWSKKVGETTYAINLIPLGGYVSLSGEDETGDPGNGQNDPKSLLSKKPWQLFIIFIAGVLMNIVLAIVLLYFTFLIGFQPIYSGMWQHAGVKNDLKVSIDDVEKGTPAETEGIQKGDIVKKVDGQNVYLDSDVITIIQDNSNNNGATVSLQILRNNQLLTKTLKTYKAKVLSGSKEVEVNRIGVVLSTEGKVSGNILSSLPAAISETWHITKLTVLGIIDLFRQLILKFTVSNNVTGPVGIFVATNYFASLGFMYLVQFTALLSVSLAVFNVLPIPGLDGGHIAIMVLELISRRKFSQRTKNLIILIGFGLLILLMVTVTIKDFINFDIIGYIKGVFIK